MEQVGSTFTNLQIYCGYEFDRNHVLDQVNKYLYDCGFEVASEGQNFDRTLTIKFLKQCPWTTMYDSFLDSPSIDDLKSTVKKLSKNLNKSVVGISVFDSDVLAMYLNDVNSDSKDLVVCSDDDGLADELGYNPNTTKGKLKNWIPFLKSDEDKKKLKELFKGEYTFAEDRLADISEMLSMDKESVCSVNSDFIDNSSDNEDFYLMRLVYREGYKPPFEIVTKGLPSFTQYISSPIYINENNLVQYYNRGGVGKGVRVILEGEILKNYNLVFSESKVFKQKDYYHNTGSIWDNIEECNSLFNKTVDSNGNIHYVAEFKEFLIPEGIKINAKYGENAPWKKIYDYINARSIFIYFNIKCNIDHDVRDDIYITLIPYDNPINGKCTLKQKITNRM